MKMLSSRRWRLAAGGAALLIALLVAWRAGYLGGAAPTGPADAKREGRKAGEVPVSVTQARTEDVPVTIDAVGTVQALNTTIVRTQVDGRLVELPFKEGEDVKKGDIVARIEPNLYQAAYDQAVAKKALDEANLANARIDVVRYQKLAASNYGSQQQYTTQKYLVAQLEAQTRADQAMIDSAKTTLEYCTIRSPIDGRAGIRLVDVGNILHASDQTGILVITQLKPIYVFFTVPQQALPAVQHAQSRGDAKVSALGPDNATTIETGTVSVIDNQIDQATGTARIKAIFANPTLRLWPGQFVNVRMIVDTIKHAVVVPSPAVQRGPGGAYVYVLEDGDDAVKLRNVTTGQQDENIAVITQGLSAGQRVVTSGFSRLSDGAKVRVTAGEGAAAAAAAAPTNTTGAPSDGASTPPSGGEKRRHRDRAGGDGSGGDAQPKRPSP
jgi:multidrug efflux system membrane fusion protein